MIHYPKNINALFNKNVFYDYMRHILLMLIFINVIMFSNFYVLGKYQTLDDINSLNMYRTLYPETTVSQLCILTNCHKIEYYGTTYHKTEDEFISTDERIKKDNILLNFQSYQITSNYNVSYSVDGITVEVNNVGLVNKVIGLYMTINFMFILVYSFLFFNYIYREKRKRLLHMMGTEGSLREQNMRILTENIHHELNTPVAIIRGTLKKLELDIITDSNNFTKCAPCKLDKKLSIDFPELNYCLDQVETVLQRMSNFKQIKYSNGNKTVMDIIKYSSNSMNIYKRSNFKINISDDLINYNLIGELSNGDLMNIISNHLRNSLEASSTRIVITCKFVPTKKDTHKGKLHIYITDNGIGVRDRRTGLPLDKKNLEEVFKPYYSTKDNSGKNKKEHINISGIKRFFVIFKSWFESVEENTEIRGVGLYLNKQMLLDNSGDLLLRETSEKGTVFEIIVSVKETDTLISQKVLFEKILGQVNNK